LSNRERGGANNDEIGLWDVSLAEFKLVLPVGNAGVGEGGIIRIVFVAVRPRKSLITFPLSLFCFFAKPVLAGVLTVLDFLEVCTC